MSSACCKVLLSNSCSHDECSHNHLLGAANSYVMDVYLMMLLPSGSTSSMMYYVMQENFLLASASHTICF